ncbi:MAG: DUF308 domain-containing protein [Thermomicrobiales bacterium]|nr:DUF308 domain-containing protein [Thermomicrobiales bacterium]MCO5218497.1 DUF308 domain-containing protein [Thermomicrobiales bacterium]MCO5224787.1 DUF308 domain-containing protein [Thermomicrobiales bacterium]MCO5227598.1 DUF308 domain-containing protein [Thermomicrobiales bacterium]
MADNAKELLNQSKPWRSDVKWEIVAVEAVILAVLGIFMLVNTTKAAEWILLIVGIVLLVAAAQLALGVFRDPTRGLGVFDSFRAGVGVTIGVIATILGWQGDTSTIVRDIIGWGLLAYATLQIVGIIVSRKRENFRPATLVLSALVLVLGIFLLTADAGNYAGRISFFGWTLLVFGIVLGGLAYLLKSRTENTTASA